MGVEVDYGGGSFRRSRVEGGGEHSKEGAIDIRLEADLIGGVGANDGDVSCGGIHGDGSDDIHEAADEIRGVCSDNGDVVINHVPADDPPGARSESAGDEWGPILGVIIEPGIVRRFPDN